MVKSYSTVYLYKVKNEKNKSNKDTFVIFNIIRIEFEYKTSKYRPYSNSKGVHVLNSKPIQTLLTLSMPVPLGLNKQIPIGFYFFSHGFGLKHLMLVSK